MQAGRLDRRITIEEIGAATDDGLRSKPGGWLPLIKCFAQLLPLTGAERIAAGENAAFQTQIFRVRRYASVAITSKNRIVYGRRVYDIVEVREVDRDGYDLVGVARSDDAPDDLAAEVGGA
jgi:SPP1 family predicted phage head-tail adaptor